MNHVIKRAFLIIGILVVVACAKDNDDIQIRLAPKALPLEKGKNLVTPKIYSFPGCKSELQKNETTLVICPERVALLSNKGEILFNYKRTVIGTYFQYKHITGNTFFFSDFSHRLLSPDGEIKIANKLSFSDYIGTENGVMYFLDYGTLYHVSVKSGKILKTLEGFPAGGIGSLIDGELRIQDTSSRWHISFYDLETGSNNFLASYKDFHNEYAQIKSTLKVNNDLVVAVFEAKIASGQPYQFLRFFFADGSHKDFKTELRSELKIFKSINDEIVALTDGEQETPRFIRFDLNGEKIAETSIEVPNLWLRQLGSVFYHQSMGPLRVYNSEGEKIVEIGNHVYGNSEVFAATSKQGQVIFKDKNFVVTDRLGAVRFKKEFEFSLDNNAFFDKELEALYFVRENTIYKYDLDGNESVAHVDSQIKLEKVFAVEGQHVFTRTKENKVLVVNFDTQETIWAYQVSGHSVSKLSNRFLRLTSVTGVTFIPLIKDVAPIYIGHGVSKLVLAYDQGAVISTQEGLGLYDLKNQLVKFFPTERMTNCQAFNMYVICRKKYGAAYILDVAKKTLVTSKVPGEKPFIFFEGQFVTHDLSTLYFLDVQGKVVATKETEKFYFAEIAKLLPNGNFLFADHRYGNVHILKPTGELVKNFDAVFQGELKQIEVIGDAKNGGFYATRTAGYSTPLVKYDLDGNELFSFYKYLDYLPVNDSEKEILLWGARDKYSLTLRNKYGKILVQISTSKLDRNAHENLLLFQMQDDMPWIVTTRLNDKREELLFLNTQLEIKFSIKEWFGREDGEKVRLGKGAFVYQDRLVDMKREKIVALPTEGIYTFNQQTNKIYFNNKQWQNYNAVLAISPDQIIDLNPVKFEIIEWGKF